MKFNDIKRDIINKINFNTPDLKNQIKSKIVFNNSIQKHKPNSINFLYNFRRYALSFSVLTLAFIILIFGNTLYVSNILSPKINDIAITDEIDSPITITPEDILIQEKILLMNQIVEVADNTNLNVFNFFPSSIIEIKDEMTMNLFTDPYILEAPGLITLQEVLFDLDSTINYVSTFYDNLDLIIKNALNDYQKGKKVIQFENNNNQYKIELKKKDVDFNIYIDALFHDGLEYQMLKDDKTNLYKGIISSSDFVLEFQFNKKGLTLEKVTSDNIIQLTINNNNDITTGNVIIKNKNSNKNNQNSNKNNNKNNSKNSDIIKAISLYSNNEKFYIYSNAVTKLEIYNANNFLLNGIYKDNKIFSLEQDYNGNFSVYKYSINNNALVKEKHNYFINGNYFLNFKEEKIINDLIKDFNKILK